MNSYYLNFLNKITLILFLLVLNQFVSPVFIFGQKRNFEFEHLSSEDGLSQNSVVKIFQDSRNFLWFATWDGMNRYDGYKFKIYKSSPSDSTSISGQGFSSICEDKFGYIWFGSLDGGVSKYNQQTDSFKRYKFNPKDPASLSGNLVNVLYFDSKGILWVGTEHGLDKFDPKTDKFTHYQYTLNDTNSLSSNFVLSIKEDSYGTLWIGTDNGLNKFNAAAKKFIRYYKDRSKPYCLYSNYMEHLFIDNQNNFWVATGEGLHLYDYKNDRFIRYLPDNNNPDRRYDKNILDFWNDESGNLWLATSRGGLSIFNPKTGVFTGYKNDPFNNHSLSSNNTLSVYKDKSGIVWIGTDGGGLNKLVIRKEQFYNYSVRPGELNKLNNNSVYSFYEDVSGDIWIGTFGGGVNIFNPAKNKNHFTNLVHAPGNQNSLVDDKVRDICKDKQNYFWIGTESGLDRYDSKTKKFKHYNYANSPGLKNNSISSLYVTPSGELWVGTFNGGLSVYNPREDKFINFLNDLNNPSSLSGNIIRKIYEDRSGIFWVCTNKGLDRYDRNKNSFIHYQNNPADPFSISSNSVLNIYQDNNGTIWVGTNLGLNKITGDVINNQNVRFTRYLKKDGLPDNNIQSIVEDNEGNIWMSTNNGLSKFNPSLEWFKNYTTNDGLRSNEFYINSCLKIKNTGEFLFGGYNGFCIFQPDSIKDDLYKPPVIFTDFYLFNISVSANTKINGDIILTKTIWETDTLILSYKNNIISIEFSALNYASPKGNKYAYILEGLETEWNFVDNRHFASFTNLPPGEYLFKVKAANASGMWNNTGDVLRIIVLPPYWHTWWFRFCFGMLIGAVIFISYKIKVRNFERRKKELEDLILEKSILNDQLHLEINEHKFAEIELKAAKEEAEKSDRLKSEFLAQMSHEIRTPINAILSFSSLIREEVAESLSDDMKDGFSIIDRASRRLIRTVDLILNMSLLQTESFELSFQRFDLYTKILKRKIHEYSVLAEEKGLQFKVIKDVEDCSIYSDDTIVEQVFDNLLNNSVKFTKQGIIAVHIFNDNVNQLVVEISDTGIGISKEYMPNLFRPFSQEEGGYARRFEGNGLGLALTKKYCDLTNIKINVDSQKGIGTKATLTF
jgi:ligand-binding sensor domain-containing protein/signal transduction histidine kinase